jgi:hypothetical protein
MKNKLQIVFLSALLTLTGYCQALIEIPFTFSDGVGGSRILTAGLDPNATDGIDTNLGEAELPPVPFGFFARFTLPVTPSVQSWKDIRQGDNTSNSIGDKTHTVNFALGTGSTGLTISWNLPIGVQLNIQDLAGGMFYNYSVTTSGIGSYTITNQLFTSFYLIVKYVDPPFPVELTSFNGTVINEIVRLNWSTATEINNFGFEIERKSETAEWIKLGFVKGNGNSNSPKTYYYSDTDPIGGSKFLYRLKQIDNDGQFEYSDAVEVILLPMKYSLYQNYPNPFNPTTKIKFAIPEAGRVSLKIFDINGREVFDLVNNFYEAGYYDVELNLSDLSSGTYIYRIQSNNFSVSKKLMLLK